MKTFYNLILLILTMSALLLSTVATAQSQEQGPRVEWGDEPLRGFNISPPVEISVLDSLIDLTGANLIRLTFAEMPLMRLNYPFDFHEHAFSELNKVLNWAEEKGNVRILIDPHYVPGMREPFTMHPDNRFWQDPSIQEEVVRLWARIADENKHRGEVIAGYDLLNEPAIPDVEKCGDQWNDLVAVLTNTIRAVGSNHPIVVEPTGRLIGGDCLGQGGQYRGRLQGLQDLILPDDDNLVVSPHFYQPHTFTFQGVPSDGLNQLRPAGVNYPGQIGNTYWDKARISRSLQSIRNFHEAHPNVPILIGEFSVSRAAGPDGDVYLRDLIELMEHEGWSWAYHDFRDYPGWDPEMPYTDGPPYSIQTTPRSQDTPRLRLLKEFYQRNH